MKKLIVLYSLFFVLQSLFGQETAPVYHPIDKSKWEKTVEGMDFQETEKKAEESEPIDINFPQQREPFSLSLPLQIVGYVLIGALLIGILIYFFGKGIFKNPKVIPATGHIITDLDERPMESDLERYLREALENKDFRLAVRIYYLMLLKLLNDKELIIWKKNKTNMDYLIEMRNHPNYNQLSQQTLIYEYVWYGEQSIAEPQYKTVSQTFIQLLQNMKNQG